MNFAQAILLSIIEGITEFLPISSTGHLVLTSHLLGIHNSSFVQTFEIVIQLGAIAAIALLYWRRLLVNKTLGVKILIAFIPTGVLGFALYPLIKSFLSNELLTVAMLFLGGLLLLFIDKLFKEDNQTNTLDKLTYPQAALIGLFQSVAMVPGVSRAAASIIGGLTVKLDRKSAVEFSFLLAIPTMLAASGYDLLKSGEIFTNQEVFYLLLGIACSFIVALVVVKWLLKYIQTHSFSLFGWYRIIFSILYYLLFLR